MTPNERIQLAYNTEKDTKQNIRIDVDILIQREETNIELLKQRFLINHIEEREFELRLAIINGKIQAYKQVLNTIKL